MRDSSTWPSASRIACLALSDAFSSISSLLLSDDYQVSVIPFGLDSPFAESSFLKLP